MANYTRSMTQARRCLFVCLALGLLLIGCKRDKRAGPPDLILITVDTLRPDHLGAYGHETARTPHIDALARRGTAFLRAFAPMGRTTPSLASMFTGLWPHEHGCREVRTPLLHGELVASVLQQAGYATVGVTANPAAARDQGLAAGFDAFVQVGDRDREERWDAEDVTTHAIRLVEGAPSDKPLLLWAHYLDPHWPYQAHSAEDDEHTVSCSVLRELKRGDRESNADGRSQALLDACKKAYDEEIAFTDTQIGALLDDLRAKKRLDNAVVLLTSDHGENLGEAGLYYAHGPNVHDASLRIPLIIAGRGVRSGATRDEVVRLVDIAPTILSLAEVPASKWPPMRGRDHASVLRGDNPGPEGLLAFAESGGTLVRGNHSTLLSGRPRTGYCINKGPYSLCWRHVVGPFLYDRQSDPAMRKDLSKDEPELYEEMLGARQRWKPGMTRERSVSDGRFKLVERPRFEGGYSRTLYDTHADPTETKDLRKTNPDAYQALSRALADWTADIPGYVQEQLSEEAEAQLKALGYID